MILVDRREKPGRHNPEELIAILRRLKAKVEPDMLAFGDICFEGNGPQGPMLIGVERKTVMNMLGCIDDAQYSAHQLPGMARMYGAAFLLIEGNFRPYDPDGFLMLGEERGGMMRWFHSRFLGRRAHYSKLRRYLFSVSLGGVHVLYSRDLVQSAHDVLELYHYFQKPWESHRSLLEMQKLAIPTMNGKPSLLRMWASDLDGIGVIKSGAAEKLFKTPYQLAQSEESDWLKIPGIGVQTAQAVVAAIRGWKRG